MKGFTAAVISYCITSIMVCAIICGSFVYACTNNNSQYYQAMHECITSGGSSIPQGNDTIVCIRSK